MRYNSYTLYFRRSDNACYEIIWDGFVKPFKVDKTIFKIQYDNGMYISRPYFDLVPANATVYSVRAYVREDSEFFNWEMLTYMSRPDNFPLKHAYSLKEVFGEEIQRLYYKEIETIIADAIEI